MRRTAGAGVIATTSRAPVEADEGRAGTVSSVYRFALRPRWLVGHVVIVVLVVVLVNLGFWQLRRLDERRAANARIEAGAAGAPSEEIDFRADPGALAWQRYRLTGTFDRAHEVLVRGRVQGGLPGYEVLTPLVVGPDRAVLVDRGWIPQQVGDRWPEKDAAPPSGEVTVTGTARPPERAPARRAEGGGGVPVVSSVQPAQLAASGAVPVELAPVWLVATQGASAGELPVALPPPDLGDGPHLSYAIQWFLFSAIAAAGWVVLVRHTARRPAAADPDPGPAPPRPPGIAP